MLKYCQAEHCVLRVLMCCQCNRCKGDWSCASEAQGTRHREFVITTMITIIVIIIRGRKAACRLS